MNYIASKIHLNQKDMQSNLDRNKLVKAQFLTKKYAVSKAGPDGKIINEHFTLGIAPEGCLPIDIIVINALSREYLWVQDSLQLWIKGCIEAAQYRNYCGERCRLIGLGNTTTAQAILDRGERIIRLDKEDGLDYFSVLPLLYSAHLKGNRLPQSQSDLEEKLFQGLVRSISEYKLTYDNRNDWESQVFNSAEVKKSDRKYVYFLAEALNRAVSSHHRNLPEAYIAMALMASSLMEKHGGVDAVALFWKECAGLLQGKITSQSTVRMPGILKDISKKLPDFPWVKKHWELLFGVFSGKAERLYLLELLRAGYLGDDEQSFFSVLEQILTNPGNGQIEQRDFKYAILYMALNERQVIEDHQKWKELHTTLKGLEQAKFDKTCFERVIAFRPDMAAEILTVMFDQPLSLKEVDSLLTAVLQGTLKKKDADRSWPRLKRLLKKVMEAKVITAKSKLSQGTDTLLMQLVDEMVIHGNYDGELLENATRLIDSKNINPDAFASTISHLIEKKAFTQALEMWTCGEQCKVWKPPLGDNIGDKLLKLAMGIGFSEKNVQLYRYLQKIEPWDGFGSYYRCVEQFLRDLKCKKGAWTREQATVLITVLRTPVFQEFMRRKSTENYFDVLYPGIATEDAMKANKPSLLSTKGTIDFVDAIFFVAHLRSSIPDSEKKKIAEWLAEPVKTLYANNFVAQAIELLQAAQKQKKVLFTKSTDAEMLREMVLEAKDFLLFAQYRNVLVALEKERFALVEAQAVIWMKEAPLAQWESVFPSQFNKQEMNEFLRRVLWSYICKFMKEESYVNNVTAGVVKRAVSVIALSDRKRLLEMIENVEMICEVHGNESKDLVLELLLTLFSTAIPTHGSMTKESLDIIWAARTALAKLYGLQVGEAAAWKVIDMRLAVLSAAFTDYNYHEISMPLLLHGPPSGDITRLMCKTMENPGNTTCEYVLRYLAKNPGKDCNIITLLRHKNIADLLSNDPLQSLNLLKPVFEKMAQENDDDSLQVLSLSLSLLRLCNDSAQTAYWFTKSVGLLKSIPASITEFHTLIKNNYDAVYNFILSHSSTATDLYGLLQHKVAITPAEPLSCESATAYSKAILDMIPTLHTPTAKNQFLQCILKCFDNLLLQDLDSATTGLLLLSTLKIAIDMTTSKDTDSLMAHISSQAKQKGLFVTPQSVEMVKELLLRFDLRSNPVLNSLALVVKDTSKCQPFAVARMQTLIESKGGKEKSLPPKERLTLLLQHSQLLKKHAGKKFVCDELITLIDLSGKDLGPIIEPLFKECFLHTDVPERTWKRLFLTLQVSNNEELSRAIASRALKYTSDHHRSPEFQRSAFDVLHATLYHLPKASKEGVLELFASDEFLDSLLAKDANHITKRMLCCKCFMQCLTMALPDTLEGMLRNRWHGILLAAVQFLGEDYLRFAPLDEEQRSQYSVEYKIYIIFLKVLEAGRWGTEEEFSVSPMVAIELIHKVHEPHFTAILNDHLRTLCDGLSVEKRKSVLFKFVYGLSECKQLSFDGNVSSAVEGVIRNYVKEHTPNELLQMSMIWSTRGTTTFVMLFTNVMTSLYQENYFSKHESEFGNYLTTLSNRPCTVSHTTFTKATQCIEKTNAPLVKELTVLFSKHRHAEIARYVSENKASVNSLLLINTFIETLEQSLKRQYRSALKEKGAPAQVQTSLNPQEEAIFDEDCFALTYLLYVWIRNMECMSLPGTLTATLYTLDAIMKRLCPDEMHNNLFMCKLKIEWLKKSEYLAQGDYPLIYKEVMVELSVLRQSLKTATAVDLYLQLLEDFCHLKIMELTQAEDSCRRIISFIPVEHFILYNGVRDTARKERDKLLKESLSTPLILSRMVETEKKEPALFLFAHLMEFPPFVFKDFFAKDIVKKCEQLARRLANREPICHHLLLDMVVPHGNNSTDLHPDFAKIKKEAFSLHPEKYVQLWSLIFQSLSLELSDEIYEGFFRAFRRLMDGPIDTSVPCEGPIREWRNIVVKVITEGLLTSRLRHAEINLTVKHELLLLHTAAAFNYFDDENDDYFDAVFELGCRAVTNWGNINDVQEFKTGFNNCISLLPKKSWKLEHQSHREKTFLSTLKIFAKKEKNKEYVKILLSHWDPASNPNGSACFKMSYEELQRNLL